MRQPRSRRSGLGSRLSGPRPVGRQRPPQLRSSDSTMGRSAPDPYRAVKRAQQKGLANPGSPDLPCRPVVLSAPGDGRGSGDAAACPSRAIAARSPRGAQYTRSAGCGPPHARRAIARESSTLVHSARQSLVGGMIGQWLVCELHHLLKHPHGKQEACSRDEPNSEHDRTQALHHAVGDDALFVVQQ